MASSVDVIPRSAAVQPTGAPPSQPPAPDVPAEAPPANADQGVPVAVSVPGMGEVLPMTRDQVRALDRRGSLLSDQLQSAQGRRRDLVRELNNTTSPAVQAGLETRIKFLDERLLSLEQEISENSAQKASLPATLRTSMSSDARSATGNRNSDSSWFSSPLGIALIIISTSIFASRFFARRAAKGGAATPSPETEARFRQMEQAIDTVAVEIERVAEGQRFVTKLLREGQPIPDFTAGRAGEGAGGGVSVRSAGETPR